MRLPLFHVDAFTDRPFSGNPAAVCLLGEWKADQILLAIAGEMNLPETAFLVQRNGRFDLRWFTPKVEVDLCGHGSLAAAHVLWQQRLVSPTSEILFWTRSGIVKARWTGGAIELDFPLTPAEKASLPPGLSDALGVQPIYEGKSRFDYLIEVESEAALRRMAPDFKRLAAIAARGVIVTSRSSEPRFDFVSRFFSPAAGINEDPVTGSAHCCLGDFWRTRLNKSNFLAYQASERGGIVRLRVTENRAFLGGSAVIVTNGELLLEA